MKKFFVFIVGLFIVGTVFAVGENIPTSKIYVDNAVAQKQNTISANNGNVQVLTNTGTAGTIGTKDIYDSSVAYETQTNSLVTAGTMNTAVQNAIDSEFVCIERNAQGECLLLEIKQVQNLLNPANIHQGTIATDDGKVRIECSRCYFDYIPVHAGDVVHLSSASNSPPIHHNLYLYSSPSETDYLGHIYSGAQTIADRNIASFNIPYDCWVRAIWLDRNNCFTPDDIVDPMVEISPTPHGYVPYKTYLPSGN